MSRRERLDVIIQRLNNPENQKKYEEVEKEQGFGIKWHFNRAKASLKAIEDAGGEGTDLLELDFLVSIRNIEHLMDEQGWA